MTKPIVIIYNIFLLILSVSCPSAAQTYQYDHEGRLTADASEEIAHIIWNNQSKIVSLTRTNGSTRPDLEFAYDAAGNRMVKIVKPRTANGVEPQYNWKYTYYQYGVDGSMISTVEKSYERSSDNVFHSLLAAQSNSIHIEDRIGIYEEKRELSDQSFTASLDNEGKFYDISNQSILIPAVNNFESGNAKKGLRQFELTNHLGDVVAVINDRRIYSEGLTAAVQQATDYYAFGMVMPMRDQREGNNYRYGFGGAEKDDEVHVKNGSYEFPGRSIYDPRLARFSSVDPLWRSATAVSPYAYGLDNPIFFSDKSGEQAGPYAQLMQLLAMAQESKEFSEKIKKERLDAFKTHSFIDQNTSHERAFVYGVIDQAIDELKILDPVEWAEAAVGLYELGNAIATGDVSAEDAYNAIAGSIKGMKEYLQASTDPNDKDFFYNNGRNAVAVISVAAAITKIRSSVKGAREIVKYAQCFVGDTEILTAGNKFVYIRDISIEKEVCQLSEEEIRMLEEERAALEYLVEIELADIKFLVEEDQLFIVNGQWIKAINLITGHQLLKLDGTTVEVLAVRKLTKSELRQQARIEK